VLEAANGPEALRLVRDGREEVDLLLTDVVMPGLSGRELAEAVRRHYPALKVLFQSGYTGEVVARHGLLQAEVALLQKPFTLDALAKKVREVLGEANLISETSKPPSKAKVRCRRARTRAKRQGATA
jgi:two-component system, cell cycle sensor histidine kinase and response regulator CckA